MVHSGVAYMACVSFLVRFEVLQQSQCSNGSKAITMVNCVPPQVSQGMSARLCFIVC